MEPITARWSTTASLADGAMGTLLFARGAQVTSCVEVLNLDDPAAVRRAHADYITAGAQLVETNTFAANRLKLAAHEQGARLAEINAAGVRLAREAAGGTAYVAGSVGPLGALLAPLGVIDKAEARDVFAEHIAAVAAHGLDLLLLETFSSVDEALLAIDAAKRVAGALPLLVSLSVVEDGRTPGGDPLLDALRRLVDAGADAVGVNCAVGPQAVYDALAPIAGDVSAPLAVMPNAGYPHRQDDRTVYGTSPAYFRSFARDFIELGAAIVGGCCGTTPEHIAAMAPEVRDVPVRPHASRRVERPDDGRTAAVVAPRGAPTASEPRPQTRFERVLGKEFVITVEVAPPRGVDYAASLAGAKLLEAAGADAVDISDNPTARLRMSGTALAHVIGRESQLATILHLTCRDRNLLGLQSELLGAAALGVNAILALTGDPSNVGDFPKATSVFDVSSVGLTQIVRALNQGKDHAGVDIGTPTRFRIGVAVNANPSKPEVEFAKFEEKVQAGADFAMTQPVYELAPIRGFLARAQALGVPVLVGVLPLRSYRNAEFLHNEVPGMSVPDAVRERMRQAKDGRAEGVRIAADLMGELKDEPGVGGAYIIPQDRYELAAEVIAAAGVRPLAHPARR